MGVDVAEMLLKGGRVFDGSGDTSCVQDVRILDGVVTEMGPDLEPGGAEVLDVEGQWVMPGFIDVHTHYDAEVLAAPGLHESVRHGVTTVMLGSCSLSTVLVEPEDAGDLFARVEALPRPFVVDTLEKWRTWSGPRDYLEALDKLVLGPNIACMLGHSDLRTSALGLGRSVDPSIRPSSGEMKTMLGVLEEALDAGFVGMSTMTNPWDKVAGDRYRSSKLPSANASWWEYRQFNRVLRRRGRVLQSAPNITTKLNVLLYLWDSMAWGGRALKTALISGADLKAEPFVVGLITWLARTVNRWFGADFRWQSLPVPFEVYSDGMQLVVFEEFGAGEAALHLESGPERIELLSDPEYRAWFKSCYDRRFTPRVWHRDFHDADIVSCPDADLVGLTIGQVADQRGQHPVDAFLDLVVQHGPELRWRTTIANHRPEVLRTLVSDPSVQIGFADSGAHLRNMAFYNFPLHLLKMARDSEHHGGAFMSVERAVHRLTAEIADWYALDVGRIQVGGRADVVVIRPEGLNDDIFGYSEAPMPGCPGVQRMVRRNDSAVVATLIGGHRVFGNGKFVDGYGQTVGTGVVLRAAGTSSALAPEEQAA